MPFQEAEEYIREKLDAKGINIETQNYVIKYAYLNQKLFGDYINNDKVIDRIINNLDHSISRFDSRSIKYPFLGKGGGYNTQERVIRQNPLTKILSFISRSWKDREISVIMHELDHCATTEYLDKEQSTVVVGIVNYRELIDLNKLNEGITSYKQALYDEALGINSHIEGYSIEKCVASFIADTIGKEQLISMHFNNDYNGIRKVFREKTGSDLNDLVEKLNKKSYIKSRIFGKLYTKKFSKDLNSYMESLRKGCNIEEVKRNTDLVPKCEIDYSKVRKSMKENEFQQQQVKDENKEYR